MARTFSEIYITVSSLCHIDEDTMQEISKLERMEISLKE
jgi:hypothetical protein